MAIGNRISTGWILAILMLIWTAASASAQTTAPIAPASNNVSAENSDDLTNLSLEDLLNVQVNSVSLKDQKVGQAAAAVTVIGGDDIQRSGLTSLPELLRLVPGMDVAQFNASTWAIGSRGFNDVFANKLLVLSDGRTVYSPLFSGVFWDMQQPMLEDLDRIEAIRGPGATIWGSNAVNGVINISSKSSRDTQGFLFSGLEGNYQQQGAVRFGGAIDPHTFFRIYTKYEKDDDFPLASGDDGFDGWQNISTGFRLDHYNDTKDTFTLQGDYTSAREAQILKNPTFTPPFFAPLPDSSNEVGYNLLGRWTHNLSDKSDFTLQLYYDHISRSSLLTPYTQDSGDISFHHRFPLGSSQEIIWGAEFHYLEDTVNPDQFVVADPHRRDDYLASAFVQDDFTLVPKRFHFIVGSKFEETSYSGFDVQPSGRLLWTPNKQNTFWGAISRAVRIPSRWEQSASVFSNPVFQPPAPVPVQPIAQGNNNFGSETLLAYELGYRIQPTKALSIDTSLSYNDYRNLRSYDPSVAFFVPTNPSIEQTIPVGNSLAAQTYGIEIAANWQVSERWRLSGSYSFLEMDVRSREAPSFANTNQIHFLEKSSPRNQAQIHSYFDITRQLQLNTSLYYVDGLAALNVPSYLRNDLGVTWSPRSNVHLTVGVQDLFDNRHPEYASNSTTFATSTQVPRTFYVQLVYHY